MKNSVCKEIFIRENVLAQIPTCNILGVNIAAINMEWLLEFLVKHIKDLSGDYITVANVHTTVIASEKIDYQKIQNGGILAIPDGGPLSTLGKKRGYSEMKRTTGPDLMEKIFEISEKYKYKHYFYGSTEDTLKKLEQQLRIKYPGIQITDMYSPPFHTMTEEENSCVLEKINKSKSDFVWVGLGAPKQEFWMGSHQGKIDGLMIGVGAGFDYHAEKIKRAPLWLQKMNLEWCYRLLQEPKRLFWRYLQTNTKFIWKVVFCRK